MLHSMSPETNNTAHNGRARLLPASLALAAACFATNANAQRPARDGAQPAKPAAAQATRSRRVADKADARTQKAAPAPAKAVPAKAAPVEKRAQAPESARTDEATAAAPVESGEAEAKAEVKTAAAAKSTPARPLSADEEIERLRAELKGAAGESRSRAQRELVDRLVALDRKSDALSELRLMIHEDRFDPPFFFNTGNALARLGDANAAVDAYRKAVSQRRGNYTRALNNLGVVLTRQGRWDEAYDALNAALTQENFLYAEASYNLGRLHLLRGESNRAQREWARTLRLKPDHADAAAALARALAEEGDEKRAAAVLEAYASRAARTGATVPRQIANAREAVAAARDYEGEDSRAPSSSPDVRASDPVSPGVMKASAPRPAARRLELSGSAYNAFQSARAAGEGGNHEEAARQYGRVLKQSGGYFAPANLELGLMMLSLNRWYDAIEAIRPVTARDGALYPVAHYHLARLYERLGRNEDAAVEFARAAQLYGDANPQMLVDLSRVREKSGDARGALEAIEAYSVAIAKQGSVPAWVIERADTLRMKLRAAATKP